MRWNKIITVIFMLTFAYTASAVVASRDKFTYRQPDGTVLTLEIHGDEFFHWTTCNGVTMRLDADGYYRPESIQNLRARSVESLRKRAAYSNPSKAPQTQGKRKFLVILVEFSDMKFTVTNPNLSFYNLLNQSGYSANGGTGSARDYYVDNSCGKFLPEFDVYGPVTLDYGYATYGANNSSGDDADPQRALYEACLKLDDTVDFSQYDLDNDGYVDNVFMYYAGHNEAEGANANTIWPHAWSLWKYSCKCDGVRISRYACTSEYRNSYGTNMAGIGTFCHEFGHVLGLPDFYDTDNESNGQASNLDSYSLMASGNYNNAGRTPPYLNCVERNILGWMSEPTDWTEPGLKTVGAVCDNIAFRSKTTTPNEYFVYETRPGTGWDKYVASGLLIYHLDKSDRDIGGTTPRNKWANNSGINTLAVHPCFYIVKASSYTYTFGTAGGVTQFTSSSNPGSIDWNSNATGFNLKDIQYSNGVTKLNLEIDTDKTISGVVKSPNGKALSGVKVCVVPQSSISMSSGSGSGPDGLSEIDVNTVQKLAKYTSVTGSDGRYSITITDVNEVSFYVMATLDGYIPQSTSLAFDMGARTINFTMSQQFTSETSTLKKHGSLGNRSLGYTNFTPPYSIMGAVKFSSSELTGYVGDVISSVTIHFNGTSADAVYIIVDFGSQRALTYEVPNYVCGSTNVVDITNQNVVIPEGSDVYIGYALKNINTQYPLSMASNSAVSGGLYTSGFSLYSSSWSPYSGNIMVSATVTPQHLPLNKMGFNVIKCDKEEYVAGDIFDFTLDNPLLKYEKIAWYYDGRAMNDSSIKLSEGDHTVTAVITFYDGSEETLTLELTVGK